MSELEEKKNIHDSVLKAIEEGKVKMRPKWHFALRTAFLILGTIFISFSLLYLVSFIVFIFRQSGALLVPAFGYFGIIAFLTSAPWVLIFLAILLLLLLHTLIKKYSFSYGKPLMYSVIVIVSLVILGGILVEMTTFHQRLFLRAEDRRLPVMGGIYRQLGGQKQEGITVGIVVEKNETGYMIETETQEIVEVILTPKTRLSRPESFEVGEEIVVVGKKQDSKIFALGIRDFIGAMHKSKGMMSPFFPKPY